MAIKIDTNTDTNTDTKTNTNPNAVEAVDFDSKSYAGFMRSASANRASTFAKLYSTTPSYEYFLDHADKLALAFSTSIGVDTATLGLVNMVSKLPLSAYEGLEAKAKLNVQVKPSLRVDEEFAKLLVPFLTAIATVSKYCKVS